MAELSANDILKNSRRCPFCAEPIQPEAIKCKHCKERLSVRPKRPEREIAQLPPMPKGMLILTPLLLIGILLALRVPKDAKISFADLPDAALPTDCVSHIELNSIAHLVEETGRSENSIVQSYRISLWQNTAENGKFPRVGEMLPGSRAILLESSKEDYKVKSPLDGSIGWVGKIQVARIVKQDTETREPCL